MPSRVPIADDGAPVVLESVEGAPPAHWIARGWGRGRNWVRHTLGVDKAIAFTVLGRGWASFAGLITVALIARFLNPAEQGYYYTFGSLVALQIIFELGFSFVILQMASHERAHLTIAPDDSISGNSVAHDCLAEALEAMTRSALIVLLTASRLRTQILLKQRLWHAQ